MKRGQTMASAPSVLLVSLPWTLQTEPSLGLGLLKAILDHQAIPARVMHLNLRAYRVLQPRSYDAIARIYGLNDFLFTKVLDPEVTSTQLRWLRVKARNFISQPEADRAHFRSSEETFDKFMLLRETLLPELLEEWADEIAADPATMVGFSCMFDQTIASLALAKLVRERAPDKLIAFGGVAVRPPTAGMLIESFPWVDAVCDGEGELVIGPLVHASAGLIPLEDVPGIVRRGPDGRAIANPMPPKVDLDANPVPDYADYFRELAELSDREQVDVHPLAVPIENSRGCWWGQKHHCIFCGIHKDDLAYRARQADRVVEAIDTLAARHRLPGIRFSDYIMPREYLTTLLPTLARRGPREDLFTELKANTKTADFELLAEAGFKEVQPGIESFSTAVLRRIDKGVTGLRNVYTMLNGRAAGIKIFYNIIHSFPGDQEADYEAMLRLVPRLVHLDAPETCTPVLITRGAPLQTQRSRFGLPPAVPESSYELLFSQGFIDRTGFRMEDFVYYFERDFELPPRVEALVDKVRALVLAWREEAPEGVHWLQVEPDGRGLLVRDSRNGPERTHHLPPDLAGLLLRCVQPIAIHKLEASAPSRPWLEGALHELDELGLIMREGNECLSLALPIPRPAHLAEAFAKRGRPAEPMPSTLHEGVG